MCELCGGGANLLVDVTKLKRGGTAKSRFSAQGSKLGRVLSSRRNLGFQENNRYLLMLTYQYIVTYETFRF